MGRRMWAPLYRAAILFLAMTGFHSTSPAHKIPTSRLKPITLWVQEANGTALYWVGKRAVGRHPLTGLEQALGPNIDVELSVILDSNVPISEMFEIDGVLDKIPIKHVTYYVFESDHPNRMRQITWGLSTILLPGSPPRIGDEIHRHGTNSVHDRVAGSWADSCGFSVEVPAGYLLSDTAGRPRPAGLYVRRAGVQSRCREGAD